MPWTQQLTTRNFVDVKQVFLKNAKNLGKSDNAKRGKIRLTWSKKKKKENAEEICVQDLLPKKWWGMKTKKSQAFHF